MSIEESSNTQKCTVFRTEREVSAETGGAISVRRLQQLRQRGGGPPFIKIGRRVLYEWQDVRARLESQKRFSTAQQTVSE